MCGIAGIVNFENKSPDKELLRKMTEAIIHRGPDDGGLEIIGRCGLGNRRLAIIDLSKKAHMPMWNEQKDICISYNGEIYNFKSLKKELINKKYRFRSNSDTEVILYLYQEYKEKFVSKLRGMFAISIWDRKKNKLILARDQFGIKPLHYYCDDKVFIFGSEIKSILLHPRVKKEINPLALSHFFSLGFGCIASPETIFKNIYKLEPASILTLSKNNRIKIERYWDVSKINKSQVSFSEAKNQVVKLIDNSVKKQLVSDVPLGSFLSGGIDSSLITGLAQKYTGHTIKTFSIGFEDKKFDESEYAKQVSQFFKTEHYHKQFSQKELMEILPDLIDKLDEPLADASILPTYLLSQYTRERVTVSLSGDGGDEIFGGYPTYLAHQYANYVNWMPNYIKGVAKSGANILKFLPIFKHAGHLPAKYKIDRFVDGMDKDLGKQYINFMGPCSLAIKKQIIEEKRDMALEYINKLIDKSKDWEKQKQLQYLDFMIYLSEDCLVKTDRASSFNSLEVRPPFLDVELVEYAFSLPSKFMVKGNTLKHLLKKSAEGKLPDNIINRPKKGFGIPTGEWLRNDLRQQAESILDYGKIAKEGIFNAGMVKQVTEQHMSGKVNHRMLLWNLFVFELWYEKWMK